MPHSNKDTLDKLVKGKSEFDPPPLLKMHYVYVLQSKKDKSLYIGFTKDIEARFAEHNKGFCVSTKDGSSFHLVAYEAYLSEVDARTRERRLKQFKNAHKELIKRINNCLEK